MSNYLIIEDDPVINTYIDSIISSKGIVAHQASDVPEALKYLKDFSIDLCTILLDFSLPGASASVVLELIRSLRTESRVYLISGYDIESIRHQFPIDDIDGFIQKPFVPKDLVDLVLPKA